MSLRELLIEHRTSILQDWRDTILETYPPDSVPFFKREKDRFNNPVGHSVLEGTAALYDLLLDVEGIGEDNSAIDGLIRMRSVQEFSPSRAIGFIFLLKNVISEKLAGRWNDEMLLGEKTDLESRIDELALLVFDIYMRCRERAYEVRMGEFKRMSSRLLNRINEAYGGPPKEGFEDDGGFFETNGMNGGTD
jgi:hypothetical protein